MPELLDSMRIAHGSKRSQPPKLTPFTVPFAPMPQSKLELPEIPLLAALFLFGLCSWVTVIPRSLLLPPGHSLQGSLARLKFALNVLLGSTYAAADKTSV